MNGTLDQLQLSVSHTETRWITERVLLTSRDTELTCQFIYPGHFLMNELRYCTRLYDFSWENLQSSSH